MSAGDIAEQMAYDRLERERHEAVPSGPKPPVYRGPRTLDMRDPNLLEKLEQLQSTS